MRIQQKKFRMGLAFIGIVGAFVQMGGCSEDHHDQNHQERQNSNVPTNGTAVYFDEKNYGNYLVTNESEIELSGTCDSASKVQINSETGQPVQFECDDDNTWSYTLATGTEGQHIVSLAQIDAQGRRVGSKQIIVIKDQTKVERVLSLSGNRVRTSGSVGYTPTVTLTVAGIGAHEKSFNYGFVANCADSVSKYETVNIGSGNQLKIKFVALKANANENRFVKIKDEAGNENCLTVPIQYDALAPSIDSVDLQLGLLSSGSFEERATVKANTPVSQLRIKMVGDESEIKYYGLFSTEESCKSATANKLGGVFSSGAVVGLGANFSAVVFDEKTPLTVYVRFKDDAGNLSQNCKKTDSILVDNALPLGSGTITLSNIPFGKDVFPKLSVAPGVTTAPTDVKQSIDAYKIELIDSSGTAVKVLGTGPICSAQLNTTKKDGTLAKSQLNFQTGCVLDVTKKYKYKLYSLDAAGNVSSTTTYSSEWSPRVCPGQDPFTKIHTDFIENSHIAKDSFLAVNGDHPFCLSRLEARRKAIETGNIASTQATDPVWTNIKYADALAACQQMGRGKITKFGLISNDQWQFLTKEISNQTENWSSNDKELINTLESNNNASGYSLIHGKVGLTNAPDSTDPTKDKSVDRSRRRVMVFGSYIYDFVGNAAEWVYVKPTNDEIKAAVKLSNYNDNNATPYKNAFATLLGDTLFKSNASDEVKASYKYFIWDQGTRPCGADKNIYCGMGKVNLEGTVTVAAESEANFALIRGGIGSTLLINKNSVGLLATEVKRRDIVDPFIGFRCIYYGE